MAYSVNGKVYSNHALMDEVIYHSKIILKNIVLKNSALADQSETENSIEQSDYLLAIYNGSMQLGFFPLTQSILTKYGYNTLQAKLILNDRSKIPQEDRKPLLKFCNQWFLDNYIEENNYYRSLMGLPNYGTTEYDIYLDKDDPRIGEDDGNSEFNFDLPIHTYSVSQLDTLESLGIIKDIREAHKGSKYRYLDFLGSKSIDLETARTASNWDILYMPNVEYLVKSRFKELFAINRDIYQFRTYQDAYRYQSDYYDEMIMLMIVSQTLADMITELPEWYVRRDVFDLRTVQYFLESQGVKFYKEIPLKYQIRIVKNLNKLIRYKSTNKNIKDILEIFAVEGTQVYKYYLFKKFLYTTHKEIDVTPPKPTVWKMEDLYDFYDEDDYEDPLDSTGAEVYDFLGEDEEDFDPEAEQHIYNFIDESADVPDSTEETNRKEELEEEKKIIIDEYGNVYDLEFIRVPINESYDDYIQNNLYREDYDTVTNLDKYWDGEDTHSYIRNNHLKKDFTIEGTKYMFLDYKVSLKEYVYQMSYFLSMIFTSKINTSDIRIGVPSIKPNIDFRLSDLCILLYCLSFIYTGKSITIKEPNIHTGKKPEFEKYLDVNGGMFFDGDQPYVPPAPEPEPEWELSDMDFGDEAVDIINYDPDLGELYDFGFNYTLDPTLELHSYDFGDENVVYKVIEEPIEDEDDEEEEDPGEHWWDNEEKHPFDLEVNGKDPLVNSRFRMNVDGGDSVRYTEITQESYYEWMKSDHPDWFGFKPGSTYGFNLKVDLNELADQIGTRHSAFGFMKGYKLSDFGVDMYDNRTDINSIDEMLEIYRNNTKAYDNLEKFILETAETRDQLVTARYIFNTLFIVPFDREFYRLKSGEIATSYDQILAERSTTLYKYYKEIANETDKEVRIDKVRTALNDITATLEFYIKSDDTKYVFSFVPTNSLEATTRYIQLMINFFKSWKVYFLDPKVTYEVDDKKDNIVGNGDMIIESKRNTWYMENGAISDSVIVKPIHYIEEYNTSMNHEVIDIYSYYQGLASEDLFFDGMYCNSENVSNIDLSIFERMSGGTALSPAKVIVILNNGSSAVNVKIIAILKGGQAIDITNDSDHVFDEEPIFISFADVDGGKVEFLDCHPFVMVNCGKVGARKRLWDLDGGGAINMQEYVDIDGLDITDTKLLAPITDNNFNIINYDIDGGYVKEKDVSITDTMITHIEDQIITNDVKISKYEANDIEVYKDGLYIGGNYASDVELRDLKEEIVTDRTNNYKELDANLATVRLLSNEDYLKMVISELTDQYFALTKEVLNDFKYKITDSYLKSYVNQSVTDLTDWFKDLNVFGWEYI